MEVNALQNLGLLESEVRVYFALLNTGQAGVVQIARITSLNRLSVYKSLQRLGDLGLVSYLVTSKGKTYQAANPKMISTIISKKEEELKRVKDQLPSLSEIYKENKSSVGISVYEGPKGAKAVWEKMLENARGEWLILGAPKSAEILGAYFKEFNERRNLKKISMRLIYNQDAKELIEVRKKQPRTSVKVMPQGYLTPASIEIIDDTTLIIIYEPTIIVFEITNKVVSQSFRQYFEMLWKFAKS